MMSPLQDGPVEGRIGLRHFDGFKLPLWCLVILGAGAGWMRAPRVSALGAALVSLPTQRLFCCAEEIPVGQAPFNHMRIQ